MASTATRHGGQETTIIATQIVLPRHGMVIVPLSHAWGGRNVVDAPRGGSPSGMTRPTDSDGARKPNALDLEGATLQGKRRRDRGQAARLRPPGGACGSATLSIGPN